MQVRVILDEAYSGPASDAVWIIDTPTNRSWFEQHTDDIDPNSAIFGQNVSLLTVIWHVFDHHPDWTEIVVSGAPLTPAIKQAVEPDAFIANEGSDEFKLARR